MRDATERLLAEDEGVRCVPAQQGPQVHHGRTPTRPASDGAEPDRQAPRARPGRARHRCPGPAERRTCCCVTSSSARSAVVVFPDSCYILIAVVAFSSSARRRCRAICRRFPSCTRRRPPILLPPAMERSENCYRRLVKTDAFQGSLVPWVMTYE